MEKQDEIITTGINANSPDQKSAKETENVQKEESIVDERTDKAAIASYPIYSEVSNGTDQNLEKASTFRQVKENISNFFSGIFPGIKKFFKKLKDKLNKKSKKEVAGKSNERNSRRNRSAR
ncbi:hypothetical protein THOM_2105 [Trachipleistophora hominis]|uniref:Uncharacterized protein n=1 Tax=Trachipleistophora hominis TaxID=72359 RepID=L7JV93_TRAHO|nr:hypothetical protein THOM_2105 [Trachipleistophora hominis]